VSVTPHLDGPTMDPLVGRHLGPYDLELPLGAGGMGTVYRAIHRELGQPRAIKVLATSVAADPAFVERLRREARLSAGLHHPNIVKVYDFGEQDGLYYVAMELLPGYSLHQILRASGPLPADRALGLLKQLADALDYAHAQGVVHRDVKPANVIIEADGHLTLVDFGISRAVDGTRLTRTGLIAGTPVYMAPEQVARGQDGPNADRYALGVVAYEMLTGRVPFESPNTPALLYAMVHTQPPPPRSFRAELPAALEEPLLRQLAKEPGARYPSAASFVAALATARRTGGSATTVPTIRPPLGPSASPTAGRPRPTEAALSIHLPRTRSMTVPTELPTPPRGIKKPGSLDEEDTCPRCGHKNPFIWHTCQKCGAKLPRAPEASDIPLVASSVARQVPELQLEAHILARVLTSRRKYEKMVS